MSTEFLPPKSPRGFDSRKWLRILIAIALLTPIFARANEPEFYELDRAGNHNGYLEPDEIPPENRTVISRYASLAELDANKPLAIQGLEKGRSEYYRQLHQMGEPGRVWDKPAGAQEFGKIPGRSGVRPFGTAGDWNVEYSSSVWGSTIGTFRKFDGNRDGLISRDEAIQAYTSATHTWFRADRDNNGLLSFIELAHYFGSDRERRKIREAKSDSTWNVNGVRVTLAHRQHAARLMANIDKNKNGTIDRDEVPESWKRGNGLEWADGNGDGRVTTLEMQVGAVRFLAENELAHQRRTDPKLSHCFTLASSLMRRYDRNNDSSLSVYEWQSIGGDYKSVDLNGNGHVTEIELGQWLTERDMAQRGEDLPDGLPLWFVESDIDADGQVELAEYLQTQGTTDPSGFQAFDVSDDGIVTAEEAGSRAGGKMQFTNRSPQVLEAQKEIYSEIYVDEDFDIADIDVRVSITKNGDDDMQLRLIGPDDTTAWLYYTGRLKAWGGARMFEDTLIDDEAPDIQQRLPRPPAHRSFRPQAMRNRELKSLSAFYGTPVRGSWRLALLNKGQNNGSGAGLLESWSLHIKPTRDR